jgi:ATP-dependent DNA helicase RecG
MKRQGKKSDVLSIIGEGEGQKIEFKEKASSLAREMVAFANTNGGCIYVGITDDGTIKSVKLTNKLKSQITDLARNCDPPISIRIFEDSSGIVIIEVPEAQDKPYKCADGFFIRIGPNSQKLSRDEIVRLIQHAGKIRFDEMVNDEFIFLQDFDSVEWEEYRKLTGYPQTMKAKDVLTNIGVASVQDNQILFTNAAILFFSKDPQKFFPEAKLTCLKYRGESRYDIIDRRELKGSLLKQLDGAMAFFERYNARQIKITGAPRHEEWEDYPRVAIREAVINALVHRDYFYDSSHIYFHLYDGFLEIDNPGGLVGGLSLKDLGSKAARRNRMLADLMQRAGYIENAGSGIVRIKESLSRNNNPPAKISATNFFSIKLIMRPKDLTEDSLTDRQKSLYAFIMQSGPVSKTECQKVIHVGSDTTLTELKNLMDKGLIQKKGKGKNTRYFIMDKKDSVID